MGSAELLKRLDFELRQAILIVQALALPECLTPCNENSMSDTQPNEELLIEENRKQFDALLVDPKFEGWAAAINRGRWSFEDFTCHNCPVCKECRSAFDFYNTDGDCLEMK